ncbi:Autophagy- protein 33 [Epichloe festucae Fl1]|uniref:Autophagy- protein 33 n=1 Tax=Epichloe festucae (strain Fl1) TaxID=877507 RepID=A0A7S9KSA6_EPIFF|nr:Autophagy- protein 33 [Epichloe festucae Fl1]
MVCAGARAVSVLKFVGTVSLGLLTGVSYTVSNLALPSLLRLPSSTSASQAIASLTASLETPLLTLTSLASAPLFLSFILSPRRARHPYLLYTSVLAVLSTVVPRLLPQPAPRSAATHQVKKPSPRARMEASYEVLGDVHSEAASEEEIEDVNGEDVGAHVEALSRGHLARTGIAALGFAMAVVGLWGDGAPKAAVIVS